MEKDYLKNDVLNQKFSELICRLEMYDSKEASDYWRDKLLELMEKLEEQMKLDLPESEDWDLNN